ncbi:hypothetical protein ACYSNU_16090 [Enterococcus sp. LJL120]
MKLQEIKAKYSFNQTSFYGWLKEAKLIEKTEGGYVAGPAAWPEMETLTSTVYRNGGTVEVTHVKIAAEKVPELVSLYEASNWGSLYSQSKQFDVLHQKLLALMEGLAALQEQLNQMQQLLEKKKPTD